MAPGERPPRLVEEISTAVEASLIARTVVMAPGERPPRLVEGISMAVEASLIARTVVMAPGERPSRLVEGISMAMEASLIARTVVMAPGERPPRLVEGISMAVEASLIVLRTTLPAGSHYRMRILLWNLTCCLTTSWFGYCSGCGGGALPVQSERSQLQQVAQPAEHPGPRPMMPLLQV